MSKDTHHYPSDGFSVVGKPHICQHTGICFKGLPAVFDPRRRHWIDLSNADGARILEQVRQCPSGALSIEMNQPAQES